MSLCACNTGGGNTGTPSCYPVFDVTKQVIFVEYYKSDGTVNGIDLSGLPLDQTYLDARINDADPATRWYASPELKNITDERAEDVKEEFEDTSSVFIQEGARSFSGLIVKGDPVLVGNLNDWRCVKMGVYFIDKGGNLIGSFNRDGWLDPIRLQEESFSVGLIKGTDTTKQKAMVNFIISSLEDDADLRMIEASEITANLLGVGGLVDVNATTVSSITVNGFTVQLDTEYGGVTSLIPAEGMEVADFVATETSPAPGAVAIATVTESTTTPGLYVFVFTAPATSADVIDISNKLTPLDKYFDLNTFTVTIP